MELKEKIKKDIEKTGFITELKVVSALIKRGWSTQHGTTYEDKDENRNREIDVVASKVTYVRDLDLRITISLVVEIKKSERPWIIFTTRPDFPMIGWRILHKATNIRKWELDAEMENGGYFSTYLDASYITNSSIREHAFRVGKAFHELEKSPNDKSKIYEALICASKASHYFKNRYNESGPIKFDPNQEVDIQFFLPTVILDGLLFEVHIADDGELCINEKDFIPVEMNYSSPAYRQGTWDAEFFPDVIRFDHLNQHLDALEGWAQSMTKLISQKLKTMGKQPDKGWKEILNRPPNSNL